jgi:site-specific DNA-methyltransferase (adenine-specific)
MACFHRGDVYDVLPRIPSKSVNLIYCDPPFGTTRQPWDESLDWCLLFSEFFRILTDDGTIVIHCSIPFNYKLIRDAPKPPNYSWYWKKENSTCPLLANKQPLRIVEEILVWKNKKTTYYRQQIGNIPRKSSHMKPNTYYGNTTAKETVIKGKTRTSYLDFKRDFSGFSTRPAELVRLMLDSYSKAGDTVLDCFCYKGLSYLNRGNRKWIGIDKYFFPQVLVDGGSSKPTVETLQC